MPPPNPVGSGHRSVTGSEEAKAVTFDEVRIKPCAREDLDKEELFYIQKFLPQHNVLLKRERSEINVMECEAVQKLLQSGGSRRAEGLARRLRPRIRLS